MTKAVSFAACAAILLAAPLLAKAKPVPEATPAGDPVDCLSLPIGESRVRDDRTIDFFQRGKVYRNVLPYACPSLGFEQAFSYSTSISRLCSVDVITVLQRSGGQLSRGVSCGLGKFQPVSGIKR